MAFRTTQQWQHSTNYNINQAVESVGTASKQCSESRRTHEQTISANIGKYDELAATMEQKVVASQGLIEGLNRRADSLEASIRESRRSLSELNSALQAKEQPLQLCMWRVDQRKGRPSREMVHDVVEVALGEEKEALLDSRRRLTDSAMKTQAMIKTLENVLEEVRGDVSHKAQALALDERCLANTQGSFQTMVERTPPPPSALSSRTSRSSSTVAEARETSRNELLRQRRAAYLDRIAAQHEEGALALCQDSARLVVQCDISAHEAAAKSEACLQERVEHNKQMRARLENRLAETHDKIEDTTGTLLETRFQIEALEEPKDNVGACSSMRNMRSVREKIADPVSLKLQEHQMVLAKAQQDLMGHHRSEQEHLDKLQGQRDKLADDLRDKRAALDIDLTCMTYEATVSRGPSPKLFKDAPKGRFYGELAMKPPAVISKGIVPLSAR